MKFEAGQKVRFTSNCGTLVRGAIYTVRKRKNDDGIEIEGESGWWYDIRFEPVEEPVSAAVVRTKEQVQADRRKELLDGVVANHTAGIEVPREWIEELFHQRT